MAEVGGVLGMGLQEAIEAIRADVLATQASEDADVHSSVTSVMVHGDSGNHDGWW